MDIKSLEQRLASQNSTAVNGISPCAVLVPVVNINGEDCIVYEVRSANLRWQPNQVCFPGGHMEQGETPVQCALRETQEELGIPEEKFSVLAQLDIFRHMAGFPVYPVLARLDPDFRSFLSLNLREVREVFTVPVEYLLKTPPEQVRIRVSRTPMDTPSPRAQELISSFQHTEDAPFLLWDIDGKSLWGLTARITQRFLDVLRVAGGDIYD